MCHAATSQLPWQTVQAPNKHVNLTNHGPKRRLESERDLSVVCRSRARR
jgi:hypothetical protein